MKDTDYWKSVDVAGYTVCVDLSHPASVRLYWGEPTGQEAVFLMIPEALLEQTKRNAEEHERFVKAKRAK